MGRLRESTTRPGERLVENVESVYEKILDYPEIYQEIALDIRRAVTLTFPYLVFYTVTPNIIAVLAIIHAAQDPDYIAARLRA